MIIFQLCSNAWWPFSYILCSSKRLWKDYWLHSLVRSSCREYYWIVWTGPFGIGEYSRQYIRHLKKKKKKRQVCPGGPAGSVAASQLEALRFDPELSQSSCIFFFPMSVWVSPGSSGFLLFPKKQQVEELATLHWP